MYSKQTYDFIHSKPFKIISVVFQLVLIILCFYLVVPNPAVILLTGTVVCSYIGGFTFGILSGLATVIYCAYFFSTLHQLLSFTPDNLHRMLTILIAIFIVVLFVGYLKKICDLRAKELEAMNAVLSQISDLDGLTEIPNRRKFDAVLLDEWKRSQRNKDPLSVAIVDIDFFKNYNDTYGHLQGDTCLKQVAKTIVGQRPGDFTARYGGEEFVVLFPATKVSGTMKVCERIRQAIEAISIPHSASSISPYVTVSIGAATVLPHEDCCLASQFLRRADIALYKAKHAGRNRVEVFTPEMADQIKDDIGTCSIPVVEQK